MGAVRLSTLLNLLGLLLLLTTRGWSKWWDPRTLKQIYQDFRTGKQPRSTPYVTAVSVVAIALMIAGMYLLLEGR